MPHPRKSPSERALCLTVFFVCIALNLGFSLVGFRNSPMEIHEFRQLQTALTSRAIQEQGWSLAYPTPLFGPPWSAPMEFPIYEVCVAKLATLLGAPIEPTARTVSLAFLYLALPACFGLLGLLGVTRERRWLALSLLLVSPIYLYYSRSIMIESTAVCASAWFLLAYCRGLERGRTPWLVAAVLIGIAAALAKVTTFIVFLVPAAIYTLTILAMLRRTDPDANASVRRVVLRALTATVPAVLVGWLWVRYSDGVKSSNPLSAFLASGPMTAFNFGTLAQRLSRVFWERIAYHTTNSVLSAFNVALIVVFALCTDRPTRRRTALLVVGFIAGPLVFANLYSVHDYYFYASALFLLGALALAWDRLLDFSAFAVPAKWAIILLSLGLQVVAYTTAYLPIQNRPMDEPPELATILEVATNPGDVLLIYGRDWDSTVPYFAHRRAVMVTDVRSHDEASVGSVLDRLPPGQVTALVVTGEMRQYPDFFKPVVARLKLHPVAVLLSADTLVYLAQSRLPRALARLEVIPLKMFNFSAPTEGVASTIPRGRYFAASIADRRVTGMMTPMPAVIMHPFGLSASELDGRTVFNAHAPTDVVFNLPSSATGAYAEFGFLPSAYSGTNETDGVEFRVELVNSDGEHRTLKSVFLSPSKRMEDRGEKSLQVSLPRGATGQLWFRTLPGPSGSIACAWTYWAKIEIK